MSLPVLLRPEATRDAELARDYLESRRGGLGQGFLDRLNETLARIGSAPEMYGTVWRKVRAARLKQFTYVVYYRLYENHVEVLAVMHGSRHSSARQGRT